MTEREIFETAIKRWQLVRSKELTLNQIANWVFGKGDSYNTANVGRMVGSYKRYFREVPGRKVGVSWPAVEKDHPNLFHGRPAIASISDYRQHHKTPQTKTGLLTELRQALSDEIRAVREEQRRNPVTVAAAKAGPEVGGAYLYHLTLDLHEDATFPIPEGVGIHLEWRNYSRQEGKLLAYDPASATAVVEVSRRLDPQLLRTPFVLLPRIEELIERVREQLTKLEEDSTLPVWKLLRKPCEPDHRSWTGDLQMGGLDQSQQGAIKACLAKDVTLLWGPPGTGKTHTLARLIVSSALAGHRVLAVAISNVAVDQLAVQVVRALEESGEKGRALLDRGRALRFGYATKEVAGEPRLFPDKAAVQLLRKQYEKALADLARIPKHELEKVALKRKEIDSINEQIRAAQKEVVEKASIVLTTVVQVCLDNVLASSSFGLTVVDEASMVPIPYLMAAGVTTRDRLVVAGDFRQLGPIALSRSEVALKWLHRDAFSLVGVCDASGHVNLKHKVLSMLTVQRRMHADICSLINGPFYAGELRTNVDPDRTQARRLSPSGGHAAVGVVVDGRQGSEVEVTPGKSRRNRKSAEVVLALVADLLRQDQALTIGVITPYRGQVSAIKTLLERHAKAAVFRERVKVGTVHAFQGSEADVIIWDIVEALRPGINIGRLYRGEEGRRLTNVAISRAKGKLLVVGDQNVFRLGAGKEAVSPQIRQVLSSLKWT